MWGLYYGYAQITIIKKKELLKANQKKSVSSSK